MGAYPGAEPRTAPPHPNNFGWANVGITYGEWFRHYHHDYYIEEPTPEEIAWGVIYVSGWPASPELHMYLTKFVNELGQKNWQVGLKTESEK